MGLMQNGSHHSVNRVYFSICVGGVLQKGTDFLPSPGAVNYDPAKYVEVSQFNIFCLLVWLRLT